MLHYEQPPQPIEIPGHPGLDLRTLTPDEVVALHRMIGDEELYPERVEGRIPADELARRSDLYWALDQILPTLPEQDYEFGKAVCTGFVNSPTRRDRPTAVRLLPSVIRVDKSYGLELWDRLLRDADEHVRLECSHDISSYLNQIAGRNYQRAEQTLVEMGGLSHHDVLRLRDAYEAAGRNENVYFLGELVLRKLEAPTEPR